MVQWLRRGMVGLGACLAVSVAWAEDWPCLRGPRYDGIFVETGWKRDFAGKPAVVWQKEVGDAYSCFTVVGDRLYTCGTQDRMQTVLCLEAGTGNTIWETGFEPAYANGQGNGTRATPTVDGDRVYIVGGSGTLACLDAQSGKEVWTAKLGPAPKWGHSGSVLIEGDMAVAAAGSPEGALVAFNKKTGAEVWKAGRERAGYGTPYPFEFEGTRYIFAFMSKSFLIVEAASGKEVMSMPWVTRFDVNAAGPIFHEGRLYVSSNYGTGSALLKLARQGEGLAQTEVWRSKDVQNRFSTMVLNDGHIYGMSEGAFVCAEFLTGAVKWSEKHPNWGNGILADGHLIVLSATGRLEIAKATPEGYSPTTRVQVLGGRCWTAPVLHNGKLYVRNQSTVMCLDLKP